MVNNLRGLVSDETLLAQIPFIKDVAAELERIEKQNEPYLDPYGTAEQVMANGEETE